MKVIFMGTPGFAVPALQALIDSEHEVVGCIYRTTKTSRERTGCS